MEGLLQVVPLAVLVLELVLLFFQRHYDRKGKVGAGAETAIALVRDGEKKAEKFAADLRRDVGRADASLSDALDDLDALGMREKRPPKPST